MTAVTEHVVMKFDDIKPGEAKKVEAGGRTIAIVRIGDDLYAIGDTCSHANYSLSEGEVFEDEREIECWKHGSTFSLETGEPQCLPATEPVPVYTVKRDANDDLVLVIEQ
jgi:3-phenylpropionate/trans-cinnamate dioxygenase ferredoxin subunit